MKRGHRIFWVKLLWATSGYALTVTKVDGDLSKGPVPEKVFRGAPETAVELTGQAVVAPMAPTNTDKVRVKAIHDGKWIAFRLTWKDSEKSEGGRLGKNSDGVALEFPTKDGEPPSVMMGQKGEPVHIIHWKAQFQLDREKGRVLGVKDHYPNTNIDMYPMDYKNGGKYPNFTVDQKDTYLHGRAAGNAQSYPKPNAVDEIFAEGFGTSQVREKTEAQGFGEWKKGTWTVVVIRPLEQTGASSLVPGKPGNLGVAVWQGGKADVGSRKSLTMNWEPVLWAEAKK